jgi:hypothetical protein
VGDPSFNKAAIKLALGENSQHIIDKKVSPPSAEY